MRAYNCLLFLAAGMVLGAGECVACPHEHVSVHMYVCMLVCSANARMYVYVSTTVAHHCCVVLIAHQCQ